MNILFIGQYYYDDEQEYLLSISKRGISVAHHKFENNILKALNDNDISMTTVLPVGNYPLLCNKFFFHKKIRSESEVEIGFINLPFVKHSNRKHNIYKQIINWANKRKEDRSVLIYDLYLPAIQAAVEAKKKINDLKVVVVVPDLPGKYCIEYESYSYLLKKYKDFELDKTTKLLREIDGSILLTKHMANALKICDKPYIVMEGLIDEFDHSDAVQSDDNKINILYAGELSKNVGVYDLISSFMLLPKDRYILNICGRGREEDKIKDLSKKNEGIIYHGFLTGDNMKNIEDKTNIYVNPRKNINDFTRYSFPSKNLEYLKHGKPVIAYKLDGIPDDYDNILFYPEDNTNQALADTIERVANLSNEEKTTIKIMQEEFLQTKTCHFQGQRIERWYLRNIYNDNHNR